MKWLLPKSEFARQVMTLLSGTVVAQFIPLVLMPVLTRVYEPGDFGEFAVYMAVISVLGTISAARYELAILLPRDEEEAAHLLFLSITVSGIVGAVLLLFVTGFQNVIQAGLDKWNIKITIFLVPVAVVLFGVFNSLTYWSNRNNRFEQVAFASVVQSFTTVLVQLVLPKWTLIRTNGLIIGYLAGLIVAVGILVIRGCKWRMWGNIKLHKIVEIAIRYKMYPLYSTLGALLNAASLQLPIFLVTSLHKSYYAGVFSMANRAISVPSIFIGNSMSQVLFNRLAGFSQKKQVDFTLYLLKSLSYLLAISVPFAIAITMMGEHFFSFVFGEVWGEAGIIAQLLVWSAMVRFCVSPLSVMLGMERTLNLGLLWQGAYFTGLSVVSFLALRNVMTVYSVIKMLVIYDIALYLFYFYLIILGAKKYSEAGCVNTHEAVTEACN